MHYIKQFSINGVDTKQVACIELQGKPNAATEGAVGVLGMDMLSPTHDVYRCVAVNGGVYTWELLSAGMSIMSATITGEGAMSVTFDYSNLVFPNNYIIKVGDLILDKEGYLYQITSIDSSSCVARYCDTRIGGVANGDNDRRLIARGGKLKLVTEGGNVLSEVDYEVADDNTIYRNPTTGKICAIGIKTINGSFLRFFVGEQSEYDSLTDAQKNNLFAIITNDTTKDTFRKKDKALVVTSIENYKLFESGVMNEPFELREYFEAGQTIDDLIGVSGIMRAGGADKICSEFVFHSIYRKMIGDTASFNCWGIPTAINISDSVRFTLSVDEENKSAGVYPRYYNTQDMGIIYIDKLTLHFK